MSTQNVNVARFARNETFSVIFQHRASKKISLIFRVENVRESNVGLDSRRPNVHLITGRQELRVAEEAGVEIQVTSLLMWPTQCQVYREQQ